MVNNVVLMGRLTKTPELKTTMSNVNVTTFTLAVNRSYGGETDFINVVAWRSIADFVTTYFEKGSMIAVEGSIQTRNYEDRNGNKRVAVEVVARNVSFCGSKEENKFNKEIDDLANSKPEYVSNASIDDFENIEDDELPF